MDYFRMVYHHDLCYHTRFSVLSSYATWFNEGRASFVNTTGVQVKLRDILSDSNGAQLRDNHAEYDASEYGHLAYPCYPYIRQFQPLQLDAVRIDGCHPIDLALFFSSQETFYRRCIQDLATSHPSCIANTIAVDVFVATVIIPIDTWLQVAVLMP
jgi:hypothetical protein